MTTNHLLTISAELQKRFTEARRVVALTGAGVSAESGVPTFRGGGDSAAWKGMPFDVVSSAETIERDFDVVWEWFNHRRDVIRAVRPNPAHMALARWQDRFEDFTLVTQNVDGLHEAAGSRDVVELHGNIWRVRCEACGARAKLNFADENWQPPRCEKCSLTMRPDIVLFGEMLPMEAFAYAARKAQQCELMFVIGTSALVYPAAALPELARAAGAFLVEVNPELTPLSEICDEVLTGKAGEVLPLFDEE